MHRGIRRGEEEDGRKRRRKKRGKTEERAEKRRRGLRGMSLWTKEDKNREERNEEDKKDEEGDEDTRWEYKGRRGDKVRTKRHNKEAMFTLLV